MTLAACASESAVAPELTPQFGLASVQLSANVAGTAINTLLITVQGSGIPTPLVFNLPVSANQAAGTLKVPAGDARQFDVKAFDSNGEITHDGSATVNVNRGQNDPLKISLVPRNGQQPVQIFMGDYSVVITPASKSINKGESFQLTAVVTAPNGDHPAPSVAWATADPSIATVDPSSGLVVGKRAGIVQIMATYGGVGGIMTLGVLDGEAPLTIIGPDYPPPGGVAFTPGAGAAGVGTGKLFEYAGLDLTATRFLAYGADSRNMPVVVYNATGSTSTVAPGTPRMTLDESRINPTTGVLAYKGTATIPLAGGGSATVNTRFTLTVTKVVSGTESSVALAGTDATAPFAVIGGYAPLSASSFPPGSILRARFLFEASSDGVNWTPATTFFNNYPLKDPSATSITSFTGAFYYSF